MKWNIYLDTNFILRLTRIEPQRKSIEFKNFIWFEWTRIAGMECETFCGQRPQAAAIEAVIKFLGFIGRHRAPYRCIPVAQTH